MHSLSFLVSRRWGLFLVAVLLLSWLAWVLGQWQFHRLDDRQAQNRVIERNLHAAPLPVAEVLAPGAPVDEKDQWRQVTATGTYDVDNTVIVRYRTRGGASGVDVVVPLQQAGGPALLVDRGWLATDNRGISAADVPAPPPGEVTVTGRVRIDATGDSAKVSDHSTRSISSSEISESLGIEVYGGFVDLVSESPAPNDPLELADPPETGSGPHFFYGLQWWFFGLLAIVGFIWMAFDEWRGKGAGRDRRSPRGPRSAKRTTSARTAHSTRRP